MDRRDDAPYLASARTRGDVARGYRRLVAVAKFALPALAAVLLLLLAIWPQLTAPPIPDAGNFGVGELSGARFSGVDSRNRPYEIRAAQARQTQGAVVTLDEPEAGLALDGQSLRLSAAEGAYDRERELLKLKGAVRLTDAAGHELRTPRAVIDVAAGTAASDAPVEGDGPSGSIAAADGFRIEDEGARVTFLGRSRLVLNLESMP